MATRVLAARLDFYNPATGALRSSISDDITLVEIDEKARGEADEAGFDLLNANAAHTGLFAEGDEVRVFVQTEADPSAVHIWTGIVDSFKSNRKGPVFAELPIKAQDFVMWRMARAYVTDVYANMTAGAIVRAILSTYCPSVTSTFVDDTSTTISQVSFNGESVLAAIRDIAELAGAEFFGDKDKNLHFYEKKTVSSGLSVGPSDVVRGSFSIETSMAGFGNIQKVRGGSRPLLDASNGEGTAGLASVSATQRLIAKVTPTKSRFVQVELWTDPRASNLVVNGGFENADDGWVASAGTNPPAVISDTGAPEGGHVAHFLMSASTPSYYENTLDIAAQEGQQFVTSFWAKGNAIVGGANPWEVMKLSVTPLDSAGNVLAYWDLYAPTGTYDWTHLTSSVFTAPAGTVKLHILAAGIAWGAVSGEGWMDDIRITEQAAPAGDLRLRIQASNAAGTGPIDATDDTRDLVNRTLDPAFLANADWTTFLLADHTLPPGVPVWLIADSPTGTQHVGVDITGTDLMWRTWYPVPVIVERQDAASVAKYGKRELPPISDKTISTDTQATLIADMQLAQYSTPARNGSYELDAPTGPLGSVVVGQTVSASFPSDGVANATDLIVLGKRHTYDSETRLYRQEHTVADAERIKRLEDIILALQRKLKRVEDSVFGVEKDTLVDLIREITDTARFTDTATATVQTGGAKVGTSRVGFSIVG